MGWYLDSPGAARKEGTAKAKRAGVQPTKFGGSSGCDAIEEDAGSGLLKEFKQELEV
jgi:hypothetical protein